jgi:periplasmic copper chaperone A
MKGAGTVMRDIGLSRVKRAAGLMLIVLVAAGCVSAAPTVTTPPLTISPAASGNGMNISGAQATPIQSNGNAVTVVATIRNETGQDDKLTGGSSPGAALVALYATCACSSPEPTDPETGLVGKSRMPWWLIKQGDTVQLRAGDGEMIVSGLPKPLAAGETIEVTFDFANAAPVTVTVPVVASIE